MTDFVARLILGVTIVVLAFLAIDHLHVNASTVAICLAATAIVGGWR